jgi:hypothetical protein
VWPLIYDPDRNGDRPTFRFRDFFRTAGV